MDNEARPVTVQIGERKLLDQKAEAWAARINNVRVDKFFIIHPDHGFPISLREWEQYQVDYLRALAASLTDMADLVQGIISEKGTDQ